MTPHRVLGRRDHLVRRRPFFVHTCPHLQFRLIDEDPLPFDTDPLDRSLLARQAAEGLDPSRFDQDPISTSDASNERERVFRPPDCGAVVLELAEVTVSTRFRNCVGRRGLILEQQHQLAMQSVPVGQELSGRQGLRDSGTKPKVELPGSPTGQSLEGVRVEAKLEHMARLTLRPRQLCVDRLIVREVWMRIFDTHQEVCNPTHAVVQERHLIDDIGVRCERVPDPLHPGSEVLTITPFGDFEDLESTSSVLGEAVSFVLQSLVDQQLGQGSKPRGSGVNSASIDLVAQREEVGAVEPCRDLRWAEDVVGHRFPLPLLRLGVGVAAV